MKIERIKIKDEDIIFEEKFDKNDQIICVLDNQTIGKAYYSNGFIDNMLYLFQIKDCDKKGQNFLVQSDVSILADDKYTVQVKGETEKENFSNGVSYYNRETRSYFSDDDTYAKNKRRYTFRNDDYLQESLGKNFTEEVVSFNYDKEMFFDIDSFFKLFEEDRWENELHEISLKYFKEVSPIVFENGDKLYITPPPEKYGEWQVKFVNSQNKEYNLVEESFDYALTAFILLNNVIKELGNKVNGEYNYPIYIVDAFKFIEEESLKTIFNLLRDSNRQVFIVMREPNKQIESFADKTVTYYYNEEETLEEIDDDELPF